MEISLTDLHGRVITSHKLDAFHGAYRLPVREVHPGVYILKIKYGESVLVFRKWVIQK